MKRHLVSASGMVNVIRTTPLESEVICGKNNAVSFRFLRGETLPKSGLGGVRSRGAAGSRALSLTARLSTAAPTADGAREAGRGAPGARASAPPTRLHVEITFCLASPPPP